MYCTMVSSRRLCNGHKGVLCTVYFTQARRVIYSQAVTARCSFGLSEGQRVAFVAGERVLDPASFRLSDL